MALIRQDLVCEHNSQGGIWFDKGGRIREHEPVSTKIGLLEWKHLGKQVRPATRVGRQRYAEVWSYPVWDGDDRGVGRMDQNLGCMARPWVGRAEGSSPRGKEWVAD